MSQLTKSLSWFAGFTGAAVPAFSSFFQKLIPPDYPWIGYLIAGIAAATLAGVAAASPKTASRGLWFIGASVVVLIAYLTALNLWTVPDLQGKDVRYQIGFRTATWSLTNAGRLDLEKQPAATPEDLMLTEAAYHPGGPTIIWSAWSIVATGLLSLVLYLAGFVLWTAGFAVLARSQ
jgi:amino acid transporter